MSNPPQGLMEYPGISSIKSGNYALSHGISPGAFVVTFPAQKNFAVQIGTMKITYGGDAISFPNCRIDLASIESSQSGQMMTVRILDRRWKWEFPTISGRYNVPKPSGHINVVTEKSPQDLATMLLKAMKESNFDVNQLPNDTRPYIDWNYDNAAEELARLCESLGCRVVLGIDNRVRICRLGNGANLPTGFVTNGGYGFDPPEMPDALEFVAAPTRYQMRFHLEAVGRDIDGTIKPIKDLSYNPGGEGEVNGWANQYPDTLQGLIGDNTLSARTRSLALSCVFRWYRITEPATGDLKIPDYGLFIHPRQVLPLITSLLDEETEAGDEFPQPQQAFVMGRFYDEVGDPKTLVNTPRGTRYPGSISFDNDRGIVQFSNPVYQVVLCETDLKKADNETVIIKSGSNAYFPADIVLECVVNVRDHFDRKLQRWTKKRQLTNGKYGTEPKVIRRDDVGLTIKAQYESLAVEDYGLTSRTTLANVTTTSRYRQIKLIKNDKDTGLGSVPLKGLESIANYYLNTEQEKFQPKESLSYSYAKIMKISPDGAIQQVSWTVGEQGAKTEASRNSEFDLSRPSHEDRRTLEYLKIEKARSNLGSTYNA